MLKISRGDRGNKGEIKKNWNGTDINSGERNSSRGALMNNKRKGRHNQFS